MNVRSVSPLIATIVLISLTIAIGAIIVGWGRAYIQKQISCADMHIKIISYEKNITSDQIRFYLENTGSTNISINDLIFKVTLKDGSQVTCYRGGSALTGCDTWLSVNYGSYSSTNLEPGKIGKFAIVDTDTNRNLTTDALQVVILHKNCGEISNVITIS